MTTENGRTDLVERWDEIKKRPAPNYQGFSEEAPTDEEGFLALHIVTDKGVKQFIVTHMMAELLMRKRKYIEYFSTDPHGKKVGASIQWLKLEDVYRNLSDADMQKIDRYVKEHPELYKGDKK